MKLSFSSIASILSLLAFCACCKKETVDGPLSPPTTYKGTPVRFDSLAVGQVSLYIGLTGEKYNSNIDDLFSYSDDTLEIAIVAKDAQGFLVAESLRYTGDVSQWLEYYKDSVIYYYLNVTDDTLKFKKQGSGFLYSKIFNYQLVTQGLPLATFSNQGLAIIGWKADLPYCECRKTGFVENYSLLDATYPYLNVLVENSAMSLDGNGETYVYAPETGLVRASTYSWWTSDGYGWDLLTVE